MDSISTTEELVHAAQGRVFVKRWTPLDDHGSSDAPIVLFHDSLGSVELWRDFPAALSLATERQVIAYDRLGFGQSDPFPGRLGPGFVSDEAHGSFAALCEQLALERFIVFGHSVGGAMATVCAATFPDQCLALVTESAQAFVEDRTLNGIRNAGESFAEEGQMGRLRKYHGDKAAWVLSAWVDTWLSEPFQQWNLYGDLPLVQCPVLAVHGENDEFGSVRHPEIFTSLSAGPSAMEILPDCGHVPHREEQGTVIDLVGSFLARLAG